VAIDGYRLFRRDRRGKTGRGIAVYLKKWIEHEELSLKNSHEQVEGYELMISWSTVHGNRIHDKHQKCHVDVMILDAD